jgi:hypothetical protein
MLFLFVLTAGDVGEPIILKDMKIIQRAITKSVTTYAYKETMLSKQ